MRTTHPRLLSLSRLSGAAALGLCLLSACGGSGGGASAPPPTVSGVGMGSAPAPTLTLSSAKRLDIAWPAQPGATAIRVLVDPDGDTFEPERVLADLPGSATGHALEVFLPTAVQAVYRIEVCIDANCARSAPAQLTGRLAEGVGYLKAAVPTANAGLGWSVALSADGETLAVAAPGVDDSTGEVLLYGRTGLGAWALQSVVRAPNGEAGDSFGHALSLSANGSILAVAAPNEDGSASAHPVTGDNNDLTNAGAVYLFERAGAGWNLAGYLKSTTAEADHKFGDRLDLSANGATLVVGSVPPLAAGSYVEVFTRAGAGWAFETVLSMPPGSGTHAGSLAISGDGDTVAVGAYADASGGAGVYANPLTDTSSPRSGAVHVWVREPAGWVRQAYLKSGAPHPGAEFGNAVDLSHNGNTLVVGSQGDDADEQGVVDAALHDRSGAGHVFQRDAGAWMQTTYLKAPVADKYDHAGYAVAVSGDGLTIALGAYREDGAGHGVGGDPLDNSLTEHGAVWLFRRSFGAWNSGYYVKPSHRAPTNYGSAFGNSVALSGNGATLAVGASGQSDTASGVVADPTGYSGGALLSGAAYLY